MGWARIDDAFDDHEKVLALLDMDNGIAAVGLWTLCLSYAHRNTRRKGKVPGLIPATLPRRFTGAGGKELANLLVQVRLWDKVDDGWMIHDFAEYLPDKEVSAARSAAGKRGAASRWGNRQTDGNLPSVDGKSDSKSMADDHDQDGEAPPGPPRPHSDQGPQGQEWQTNDNLPFDDDNEPSICHGPDDKSEANDGSRAGARRARVAVRTTVLYPEPDPEPVPPSAGAAAPRPAAAPGTASETQAEGRPVTAQTLVAEWIDSVPHKPPGDVRAQVGRKLKTMLDEGIDPDGIREGLRLWASKGLHPSTLPSVVNEVMNAAPATRPRAATRSTTDDRVAAIQALKGQPSSTGEPHPITIMGEITE